MGFHFSAKLLLDVWFELLREGNIGDDSFAERLEDEDLVVDDLLDDLADGDRTNFSLVTIIT
jgi:hypothetical protein